MVGKWEANGGTILPLFSLVSFSARDSQTIEEYQGSPRAVFLREQMQRSLDALTRDPARHELNRQLEQDILEFQSSNEGRAAMQRNRQVAEPRRQ